MNSSYIIRKADLSDVLNLTVLKQQVWISTYAFNGIRDELSQYVLGNFTPDKIKSTIDNPNNIVLVAEKDDHIVGCAEIDLSSQCPEENYNGSPEISVLYVLERFQGIGIGKKLLNKCIDVLALLGYKSTWLTVYDQNFQAIKFYERNGFENIGCTHFKMGGNKIPNEIMFLTFNNMVKNENS